MELPKISIIIAVYNSAETLSACMDSVIGQSYQNKELIIIDGGSEDSTVDLIKSYSTQIDFWISEKDEGIYDAWNKGLRKATGEWICFLGSDDTFASPNILKQMIDCVLDKPEVEYITGKALLLFENGDIKRINGQEWNWKLFKRRMGIIVHPSSLHRKSLFEIYGEFDSSYNIAGDYDFLLRPGPDLKTSFLPIIVVNMALSGTSTRNALIAYLESYRAQKSCIYIKKSTAVINLFANLIQYYAGLTRYWIVVRWKKNQRINIL